MEEPSPTTLIHRSIVEVEHALHATLSRWLITGELKGVTGEPIRDECDSWIVGASHDGGKSLYRRSSNVEVARVSLQYPQRPEHAQLCIDVIRLLGKLKRLGE